MKYFRIAPSWVLPIVVIIYFSATVSLVPPVRYFEQASDEIIVNSLRSAELEGDPSLFMQRVVPQWSSEPIPYYSQFALTYRALLPIRHFIPYSSFHFVLSMIYAAATGAVFWWFQKLFSKEHGTRAGTLFLIISCLTPTFLLFSGSFYWQLPLLVGPFFVAYILAPTKPLATTALVFLLLIIRFLGGYEYTSSLILSPIAAVALRCSFGEIELYRGIKLGIFLLIAGTMSFAIAIALHLGALYSSIGNWEEAIVQFKHVVNYRTVGDSIGREVTLRNDIISLACSFFGNEVTLVGGIGLISLYLVFRTAGGRPALQIGAALLLSFVASISWQVLARGHMRDHNHINFIVYFIPFGLSTYLIFCRVVGRILELAAGKKFDDN